MVAYSFKHSFILPISAGTKRQTIRLPRKRHARAGEAVQLYAAMRTRYCRKIIPDPLCVGVDEVIFDLRGAVARDPASYREALRVNGIPVVDEATDAYARGDGFDGSASVAPFAFMVRWWLMTHGAALFEGVAIRWEPRP
jgi:hypothetical protein